MNDEEERESAVGAPPSRQKHASLVDIVAQAVEHAVEKRFDSLIPMNERQLEILTASEEERERRKTAEIERAELRQRVDRFYKILVLILSIILVSLEIYRAAHR